jgi:hypothetical protein
MPKPTALPAIDIWISSGCNAQRQVALEVNLLQKVAQLVGDVVRGIAAERSADQLLSLGQELGVKRECGGAAEQDGARRLGVEAGGEGGGGLGLQLVRLAEMAQRQHLVALSAGG